MLKLKNWGCSILITQRQQASFPDHYSSPHDIAILARQLSMIFLNIMDGINKKRLPIIKLPKPIGTIYSGVIRLLMALKNRFYR